MRKIKFRVRFKEFVGNQISGGPFCYYNFYDLISNSERFPYHLTILSKDQCTELKDKNGKEIYEGDILASFTGTLKALCIYENGAFKLDVAESGFCNLDYYINHGFRLVGNIYENSDLLRRD